MKTIDIKGKKYRLVPIEEEKASQDVSKEVSVPKKSSLDEYTGEEKVKKAVPKVSEYRERFKKKALTLADVTTQPTFLRKLPSQDSELAKFGDLIIGPGIEQEI